MSDSSKNNSVSVEKSNKVVNFRDGSGHVKKKFKIDSDQTGKPGESREAIKQRLAAERKKLPIHAARASLIQEIRRASSAVVIGETGSGKTTQIAQYIYEAGLHYGSAIACTQPRRVAAVTVAERVAAEMGVELGKLVGYSVRFDDKTSADSRLIYLTDGMLLREALLNPMLSRYSVVILDEAHERTIQTDVLFGVVKAAQRKRAELNKRPLKIIVMSATMDVDQFSRYFTNAKVLYIEGRQHSVELLYSKQSQSDYLHACVVSVFQIHKEAPPNEDILVFLTGAEEIEAAAKSIRQISRDLPTDTPPLVVCTLYAAMAPSQQLKVFQKTLKGSRKVILATNIAETSVTIPDIKHVVDSGMVKSKTFNPTTGLDLLVVGRVSAAQAWQRTGRAGREGPGLCYRLYTEAEFDKLSTNTKPEILRCNLSGVILQLLAMGIKNVETFDFMDKPSPESIAAALEQLHWLGAIDSLQDAKLTEVGRKMAALPLDPRLAKVLMTASELKCLEEAITVAALLDVEQILTVPPNKREEAEAVRRKFLSPEGDHVTLLNIYRAYKSYKANKDWCYENFINMRNMKAAQDIRKQLRQLCVDLGLEISSGGRDTTTLRKSICAGFFMNVAQLGKEGNYVTLSCHKSVFIHPSSALFQYKPSCVVYHDLLKTAKSYIRSICVIDSDWLAELAPASYRPIGNLRRN